MDSGVLIAVVVGGAVLLVLSLLFASIPIVWYLVGAVCLFKGWIGPGLGCLVTPHQPTHLACCQAQPLGGLVELQLPVNNPLNTLQPVQFAHRMPIMTSLQRSRRASETGL